MTAGVLFGTSATLDGIQDVIAKFYAGERKVLREQSPGIWSVHKIDGTKLATVVRLHKGRYRFESIPKKA